MYYYPTASDLIDSDIDGSMIERVISFGHEVETSIDDAIEDEPDTEPNGGIPGYPGWSVWLALILVSLMFYRKQRQ